jgi:hypothetical protein
MVHNSHSMNEIRANAQTASPPSLTLCRSDCKRADLDDVFNSSKTRLLSPSFAQIPEQCAFSHLARANAWQSRTSQGADADAARVSLATQRAGAGPGFMVGT